MWITPERRRVRSRSLIKKYLEYWQFSDTPCPGCGQKFGEDHILNHRLNCDYIKWEGEEDERWE